MMSPILLTTEAVASRAPVDVFEGFLDSRPWMPITVEPPHNVEIELQFGYAKADGFAHRRFLSGRLTFWVWFGLTCRCVEPRGWRPKA